MLRALLNRLRWDGAAAAEGVVLAVRVRRDGGETTEDVPFAAVAEILPAGFTVADGTFLPYHRVVCVRRDGEVLWRSVRA
ncbi:MAG TPA: DUF504 domain-containing protein [Thermoanaerobaculaceae bacterium]|nr:DUF504 domain-containing protein [Thermoanaerobaculaceae bacterium]